MMLHTKSAVATRATQKPAVLLRPSTIAAPRLPLRVVSTPEARPVVIANAWTPSIKPNGKGDKQYPNDHLTHTVEGTYETAMFYAFFVLLMTAPVFAPALIPFANYLCGVFGLNVML